MNVFEKLRMRLVLPQVLGKPPMNRPLLHERRNCKAMKAAGGKQARHAFEAVE
ncbi:hypothetical protein [Pseudomonas guariconensis]|uniref:hypothetical protein n=1 Tax=Pseudomonas guariconensis TaxID=1288410 RepID=UPI0018A975C7|nr:hypothetical protein [Pseudomonas guariconensis]MBF8723768.1 hypothetical protein [Pseudomonas guariconensis]